MWGPTQEHATEAQRWLDGEWETSKGLMKIEGGGGQYGASDKGKLLTELVYMSPTVVTGKWGLKENPGKWGTVKFELGDDRRSFVGGWEGKTHGGSGGWTGTRPADWTLPAGAALPPAPPAEEAKAGVGNAAALGNAATLQPAERWLDGTWDTSKGLMKIDVTGGDYSDDRASPFDPPTPAQPLSLCSLRQPALPCVAASTAAKFIDQLDYDGKVVTGRWALRDNAEKYGKVSFALSEDGNSFEGGWEGVTHQGNGPWTGKRFLGNAATLQPAERWLDGTWNTSKGSMEIDVTGGDYSDNRASPFDPPSAVHPAHSWHPASRQPATRRPLSPPSPHRSR